MPRARTLTGLGLLLAGLAVVGWYGWQFYGTTWRSHQAQRAVVERVERAWQAGRAGAQTEHGTSEALVRIPRFGKNYVVPLIEGTSDEALASGIGHVEHTAPPGQVGNVVLAAHRITHGEPFANLPELRPGDEVDIETQSGTYVYVLTSAGDDLEVSFDADWVLAQHPSNPDPGGIQPPGSERLLTLTTCAELFHTDERLVVFGELRRTETRRS